ncbi:V-type proton ATPase subunit S1-like [Ylistrum balloti]|uniref:V-type proton ATPase subunit S1-like n=1 Tax=Ylistrum balloti TaxID=509963 RepID=UPI002905C233|nr:V-type proton ATPase subunit S1-like [Ylistrum balloti]
MLAVCAILFFVGTCTCTSDVPVLIWSQSSPMSQIPQVNLGNTVKVQEFSNNYLTPLRSQKDGNLVVFLQEKLSVEDFTKYGDVYNSFSDGGAFKNVKALMDENFSVHLPAVSSPLNALNTLRKTFDGKVHEVTSAVDVDDLDLGSGIKNLIIVKLAPGNGAQSEEESLASNDGQIGDVVRRLDKRELKYTALYTAKSAVQNQKQASSVKRHLLAAETLNDNNNGTFLNMTCMYFYIRTITAYLDKGGKNTTVHLNETTSFTDEGSTCGNSTAMLKFKYDDGTGITLTMTLDISDKNSSDWQVETFSVEVVGSVKNIDFTGDANMNTKKMNVGAPKDFSYHCSRLSVVNATADNTTTVNVSLVLDGFQLQPFNIINNQFSDGWDCVPFFTEGIWMGLLSVLLLTLILLYGFSMLADIRTMDKFDDSKGKTITVNVSE